MFLAGDVDVFRFIVFAEPPTPIASRSRFPFQSARASSANKPPFDKDAIQGRGGSQTPQVYSPECVCMCTGSQCSEKKDAWLPSHPHAFWEATD